MTRVFRPHRIGRPHGRCTACGAAWPCSPARISLLWQYRGNRVYLAVLLAATFHDAIDDAYRLGLRPDLDALHERFLGWLPRSTRPHPGRAAESPPTPPSPSGGQPLPPISPDP